MVLPIEITVRDLPATEAIESRIRSKAEKLVQYHPRIEFCKVVVEEIQKHKHNGKIFNTSIEVKIPNKILIANKQPDEDLYVSIRDAFDAIARQLEDAARKQRGEIKAHAEELTGKVVRIFDDYGFIETSEGNEYYFSAANLMHNAFPHLKIGVRVRFIEDLGGDSLHATHVNVID